MKCTVKKKKLTADEIAEKAMSGDDISEYITNKGEMKPAIHRVNVDFSVDMLKGVESPCKGIKYQPAGCYKNLSAPILGSALFSSKGGNFVISLHHRYYQTLSVRPIFPIVL